MSNMSMYIGEFVGTTLLLLLGNGVNMTCSLKHSYGKGAGWIVTTFGWGFAVYDSCLCNRLGIRCTYEPLL